MGKTTMTLKEAFEEFILSKRLSGIGENSIINYKATISLMLQELGWNLPVQEVTWELVSDYILNLLKRPLSRATISSYIRNDRIFLRWVSNEFGLPFDPTKIKVPKSPKKNVHIYTDSEIAVLFSAVKTSIPWITARNIALLALMLDSGLRQFEVCSLLKVNIDKERHIIRVTGKGAKDRMVPIGDTSLALLDTYLSICPYDGPYIFYGRRGQRLSGNAIRLFVYRLEKKLPFSLSSHKLRHNFATNFCIDHIHSYGRSDVYDLSIIMGHESIETTKRYEHFAHEMIAAQTRISHLDMCLGKGKKVPT